ncbi:MAG: tRNA pseudouridine(38-40) synthase TruA [Pirellulales bacterium]
MPTFKLTLAYDGTNYCGWQVQPGQATLQATLEQTLERITGESMRVFASGRTDAGVHALGQVVSFTSHTHLSPSVLQKALNAELPHDMAVVAAEQVADGFHATRDAVGKRYRYTIEDGPTRDVFARQYVWHHRSRLDAQIMHRAAQALVGRHDFSSFESAGSERESSVRTIFEIRVARDAAAADRLSIEVAGDGFLYNMVRAIVGTLVDVGRGERTEAWPGEVLAARDRRAAGRTAPAQGLCLVRVDY